MANQIPQDVTLRTVHEDLTAGFADLKGEMADLKGEVRSGFADLKDEIGDLKGEMRSGFGDLKGEIGDLKGEMRSGFADLKATLIAGFRGLPSRESSEEMVRLLREGNRLQEARFTQLDLRIREQHLEVQQILHAVVDGQRILINEVRTLAGEVRNLSGEIKALIARIDALIKGRGDGGPAL